MFSIRHYELLVAMLLCALANVSAHTRFTYPPPRSDASGLKTGPCGGVARTAPTAIQPGPLTLVFEETIKHTGAPWRIALSDEGADTGFEECILLDHIPHPGASPGMTSPFFRVTVNIPDVQCTACTLQILSVMTDKIGQTPGAKCTYNPLNTQAPLPNCFSNYHSCADVSIAGTVPRANAVCQQPANWPWLTGKQIAGVRSSDVVAPLVYRRETAQWCPDGYLRDVPTNFKTPVGPGATVGAPGQVVVAPANPGSCPAGNLAVEVEPGAPGGNAPAPPIPGEPAPEGGNLPAIVGGAFGGMVVVGAGLFALSRKSSGDIPPVSVTVKLPPGWTKASDPTSGKTYYYNSEGKTQWSAPIAIAL